MNQKQKSFYITTTLPYVNSDPHIGFAMEIVRADIIARYRKLKGDDVFFNTGTDEHGLKIYRNATAAGQDPQAYADGYAEKFKSLKGLLGLLPELHFIRTTDAHHVTAAQEFWKICDRNGYIYKKNYSIKYCIGCELEKTESELVDGKCPLHPNLELEIINEDNYFFKFSAFRDGLQKLYAERPDLVVPDSRFNEIKAFVNRGLEDFSISRLKEKMPWGVPVPDDDGHVMYVWFDALVNYISTLGWPEDTALFEKFWKNGTTVQYCGKDNLRQQSAMWQAMLSAAGLPPTRHIVINGFITSDGQKMSKSVGNVIDPHDVVAEYGVDALRYFVARELSTFEDSDFTPERFKEAYNVNLANGIGNLTSRIMKMATTHGVELSAEEKQNTYYHESSEVSSALDAFKIGEAMDSIWRDISWLDGEIQRTQPFKKIKEKPEEAKQDLHDMLHHLLRIALKLEPFMPDTSRMIQEAISHNTMPEPLFARKD